MPTTGTQAVAGALATIGALSGSLAPQSGLSGSISGSGTLEGTLSLSGGSIPVPEYGGPYEVTPTEEMQTLYTSGRLMSGNVTVNPIPTNYGKITVIGNRLKIT